MAWLPTRDEILFRKCTVIYIFANYSMRLLRIKFLAFLVFGLLIVLPGVGQAQDTSTAEHPKRILGFRSLSDTLEDEKDGFFALPLIYYTPDTRWAAGGAGVYYFKLPSIDSLGMDTRVSNVQFLADYTQNKQLDLWGQWNVFTRNENYLLKGEFRYRNFPDKFYGIGHRSLKQNEEKYAYDLVSFKSLFLKKVYPNVFLGLDYHFEKEFGFKYTSNGSLEKGDILGFNGGNQSAIGIVGVLDSRDNVINAYKGTLLEVSTYLYRKSLGSTFDFSYLNATYQTYLQVKPKQVLAIQAKARLGYGDVPFLDLSAVGSDDLLRGYPKNRFKDVNFVGAQAEYRFPLFWRLGMVVFAGAGDVFNKPSDLTISDLKWSIGSGLRVLVNPQERLNVRFDYGYGKEGGYFYFVVAESF